MPVGPDTPLFPVGPVAPVGVAVLGVSEGNADVGSTGGPPSPLPPHAAPIRASPTEADSSFALIAAAT
jgi:hypothetical protein